MYSKQMQENVTTCRNDFLKFFNPQSLVELCRLKQHFERLTPASETDVCELYEQASLNNIKPPEMDDVKNKSMISANIHFEVQLQFSTYDEIHGVINALLDDLQHLDFEIRNNEGPSQTQIYSNCCITQNVLDNEATDGKAKVPHKGKFGRRNLERKIPYRSNSLNKNGSFIKMNEIIVNYGICFEFREGATPYSITDMPYYRSVIDMYIFIFVMEEDIMIMDCKFHIYINVKHLQIEVPIICDRKLNAAQTAKLQNEQPVVGAHLMAELSNEEDEVEEHLKEDDSSVTQKHGHIVFDDLGKDDTVSNDESWPVNSKQKKEGLLFWLLQVVMCILLLSNEVNAKISGQVEEKYLLTSGSCSQNNFYSLKENCHIDEIAQNFTIDNCNFKELCSSDEYPDCLNSETFGVYVCLKKGLACPRGRMIMAWQDDKFPDRVYLKEVDCPNDTFQPTESDCIHACLFRHRNMSEISDKYIVSSEGDNINPITVSCNFKKGYYNPDGILNLNYDQDEILKPDFCLNVVDYNPCTNGYIPLQDGVCVKECEPGLERNPPDFDCRQMSITSKNIPPKPFGNTTHLSSPSTTTSTTSTGSLKNVTTVAVNEKTKPFSLKREEFPAWAIALSCILGVCVLVFIVFLAVCYRVIKRAAKSTQTINHVKNKGNTSYTIIKPNNVTILDTRNGQLPDIENV